MPRLVMRTSLAAVVQIAPPAYHMYPAVLPLAPAPYTPYAPYAPVAYAPPAPAPLYAVGALVFWGCFLCSRRSLFFFSLLRSAFTFPAAALTSLVNVAAV